MNRLRLIIVLFIVTAAFAAAQVPVYVDLDEANSTIADLQAEIDAATTQSNELTSANDGLDENTSQQQDKIAQARDIIAELRVSRGELYGARNRANDIEQKKRIIEQLEKNMAQEHQLELMIDKFNGIIDDNDTEYRANKKQIARNNLTIQENNDEITYLNACIELTSNSENNLSDIFSRQDQNTSSFDSFMNANQ